MVSLDLLKIRLWRLKFTQVKQESIEVPVLVVGAGPVGQLTALQLGRNGIRCMLVERNATTTQYPKMEYINMRSMELLHRMGLADRVREIGVPGHYDLTCLYTTGLGEGGEAFSRWVSLTSIDEVQMLNQITEPSITGRKNGADERAQRRHRLISNLPAFHANHIRG